MTDNNRNDKIHKSFSIQWIAIVVLFAAAAVIVTLERGLETGLHVTMAIAMFGVLLRIFLELLYFFIDRKSPPKIWFFFIIVGALYVAAMLFLGMERAIVSLLILSFIVAAVIVLIERILTLLSYLKK